MKTPQKVELSTEEQAEVRKLEAGLVRLKVALADNLMTAEELAEQRRLLARSLKRAQKGYIATIKAYAKIHGVMPSKDSWNFNADALVFEKVGS